MIPPISGMSALAPDRHVAAVAMPGPETVTGNWGADPTQHVRNPFAIRSDDYQSGNAALALDRLEQWGDIRRQEAKELEDEFDARRIGRMSVGDALRLRQRLNEQELTVTFCKTAADSCVQCVKTLSSGS